MAVAAHHQVSDVLRRDRLWVRYGRRIKQGDQLGKGLWLPVVRSRRGEDQCVSVGGKPLGQLVVERALVDQLVRLVDPHGIPADPLQVRAVAAWALEGVNRDNHSVEIGEGVPAGRDPLAHPLNPFGVQSYQWERKTAPQLVLDLIKDVARHDTEHPISTTSALKLRKNHADLNGLSESYRVGDEQARLKLAHRYAEGLPLEGEVIGQSQMSNCEVHIRHRHWRAADHALENQACLCAIGRLINTEGRPARIFRLNAIKVREERRRLVPHQFAAADASDDGACAESVALHTDDLPVLIPNNNSRAWSDQIQGLRARRCICHLNDPRHGEAKNSGAL